jgi:hypothetical protein
MDITTLLKRIRDGRDRTDSLDAPTVPAPSAALAPRDPALQTPRTPPAPMRAGTRSSTAERDGTPPSAPERDGTAAPSSAYTFGKGIDPADAAARATAIVEPHFPSLKTVSAHYPHVMKRLREAWADPRRLRALARELLLQDRPQRQGFTPEALLELTQLLDWCDRQCAQGATPAAPRR